MAADSIWMMDDAPVDGSVIVALGHILWSDETGGGAYVFCARIAWRSDEWVHAASGMSLIVDVGDEVVIEHWLPEPVLEGVKS